MKDKKRPHTSALQPPPVAAHKKPYHPPVFQVYGTVTVLTQGSGSGTNDSTTMKWSDINLKQNIVRVGTHPLGFGLYLFEYKAGFAAAAGQGRQFGVLAQEVETVMPAAVAMQSDGYKKVDYAVLGIRQAVH